jgi:hypothetical protein
VLYRPYGGAEVMRDQLLHLEDLAKKRHVTLQVMPFGTVTHPGFEGVLGTAWSGPVAAWTANSTVLAA